MDGMRQSDTDDGLRRSRRRGDELLQAIYSAVLVELADTGYGGLTMEGVAARAGTGKAPLYRRWNSKDGLILDTVQQDCPPAARTSTCWSARLAS